MDAFQSGNILELVVRAASLCDLLLSFTSGLKLGEVQVSEFKFKLERFLLCCHLANWFVKNVEQLVVSCGCRGLSHTVACPYGSSQLGWDEQFATLPLHQLWKNCGLQGQVSIQADSFLFPPP